MLNRLFIEERSTATVAFLLLSVTLYLAMAGVWNTGALVDQKMEAQAIADAAALSAAMQICSTVNETVMLNMLQLRTVAGEGIRITCITTSTTGIATITGFIAANIAKIIASRGLDAEAWAQLGFNIADMARINAFTINHAKGAGINNIGGELAKKYNETIDKLPENIAKQIAAAEKFVNEGFTNKKTGNYNIYVAHPQRQLYPATTSTNQAKIIFTRPNYDERYGNLALRAYLFDEQWKSVANPFSPPTPMNTGFKSLGKLFNTDFFKGFKSSMGVSLNIILTTTWFTTLSTTVLAKAGAEWGYVIDNPARNLQVIAVAERVNSNETFMATGFFKPLNAGNSVVALAQAEAYNASEELLATVPILKILNALNWQMWSSVGATYQARLTRIKKDNVNAAIDKKNGTALRGALERNLGKNVLEGEFGDVFLH